MSLLSRFLAATVTRGRLDLVWPDGSRESFGRSEAGFPDVAIRLAGNGVARQIMLDPRLGAAEAFMDGTLTIEQGDIMDLVGLLRANKPWERTGALYRSRGLRRLRDRVEAAYDGFNEARSARANVSHHYDIGNALYRLFLDSEHMQYSCAYWPRDGMTLEAAQAAKLAHIAAKLALKPGHKVLDIGCGWGGMAIYLARHFDVRVHGVTLSEAQLTLAKERAEAAGVAGRVDFGLIDYRDLARRKPVYDRIVSVGMFEHVGRAQFGDFFRAAGSMLKPDGVMLLHTIGRMGGPGSTDAFTRKYIFPGGYIPALSETLAASEKCRLIASDIETLRLHYAKTLREWYARTVEHRDEIEALYDARFFRMWTFYLAGATAAFETGGMCNYQIQYVRDRNALPLTRDYIAKAETAPAPAIKPRSASPRRKPARSG